MTPPIAFVAQIMGTKQWQLREKAPGTPRPQQISKPITLPPLIAQVHHHILLYRCLFVLVLKLFSNSHSYPQVMCSIHQLV
jgi:hypothetical protein